MNKILKLFLFIGIYISLSSCNYNQNGKPIRNKYGCECDCNVCKHGGCPKNHFYQLRQYYNIAFNANRYYKYFVKYYQAPGNIKYSLNVELPIICSCEIYLMSSADIYGNGFYYPNYSTRNMMAYFYSIHNLPQPQMMYGRH